MVVLFFNNHSFYSYYITDGDLLIKKENSGNIKKIKANVINFDQSVDEIQIAEEVKSDEDVMLAIGDEAAATSSYNKIVRFKIWIFKFN